MLRSLSLSTTGKKADLQNRLIEFLTSSFHARDEGRINNLHSIVQEQIHGGPTINRTATNNYRAPPPLPNPPVGIGSRLPQSHIPQVHQVNNPPNVFLMRDRAYLDIKQPPPYTFEPNVFYTVKERLTADIVVPPSQEIIRAIFKLEISPEKARLLKEHKISVMVFSVAIETPTGITPSLPISFHNNLSMRVNGNPIPDGFKGLKGKEGTAKPADISRFLSHRETNSVEISLNENSKSYAFSIFTTEPVSVDSLITRIHQHPHILKEETIRKFSNPNTDDEIEELSIILPLKCPLSFTRIKLPTRSIYCEHIECFDADSFIQLQQQATTWICPVCNKKIRFEDISIDDYMDDVLKRTAAYDISEIEIETNGTWKLPADAPLLKSDDEDDEDGIERGEHSHGPQENAVVISFDSDGEEIEEVYVAPSHKSSATPAPVNTSTANATNTPNTATANSSNNQAATSSSNGSDTISNVSSGRTVLPLPNNLPTPPAVSASSSLVAQQANAAATAAATVLTKNIDEYSPEELISILPSWKKSIFGQAHRGQANNNMNGDSRNKENGSSSYNNSNSTEQQSWVLPPINFTQNKSNHSTPTNPPPSATLPAQGPNASQNSYTNGNDSHSSYNTSLSSSNTNSPVTTMTSSVASVTSAPYSNLRTAISGSTISKPSSPYQLNNNNISASIPPSSSSPPASFAQPLQPPSSSASPISYASSINNANNVSKTSPAISQVTTSSFAANPLSRRISNGGSAPVSHPPARPSFSRPTSIPLPPSPIAGRTASNQIPHSLPPQPAQQSATLKRSVSEIIDLTLSDSDDDDQHTPTRTRH